MKFFVLVMTAFFGLVVVLFLTMDSRSYRVLRPAPEGLVADRGPTPIVRIAAAQSLGTQILKDRSVSEMASDLERARVFAEVLSDSSTSGEDLLFEVQDAGSNSVCGMPLMASTLTLGLVPGYFPFSRHYEFRVTQPDSGVQLDCAARYSAETLSGIWALPKRVSPEWVGPPEGGSAVLFDPHLRHDFAALAVTMQDASDSSEAERILAREAPELNCRLLEDTSVP